MLVVQLEDVSVCQEARGLDSDIRVKAGTLSFDESTEVQWQEFQVFLYFFSRTSYTLHNVHFPMINAL